MRNYLPTKPVFIFPTRKLYRGPHRPEKVQELTPTALTQSEAQALQFF